LTQYRSVTNGQTNASTIAKTTEALHAVARYEVSHSAQCKPMAEFLAPSPAAHMMYNCDQVV